MVSCMKKTKTEGTTEVTDTTKVVIDSSNVDSVKVDSVKVIK